ncbi:MAG: hypothetical protein QG615_1498 [Nitrospirota bacterium]|nr:hypothetical protein [Nitrospirota bacterium]
MMLSRKRSLGKRWTRGCLVLALVVCGACGEFETGYFQSKVNQVTQDEVAKRYGAPHKMEKQPDGRTLWIYYVRGSGTSSYSGTARASYCRAYQLTFDDHEVLRDWREEDCAMKPATITGPFSDRN